ncbi:MAG: hypothetical protein LBD11_01355 [Candidatus Peribacteria bacterium]|jgi:lactate dehydrogenase-like 2-hydroxyacid dehydrogenase|nr:hypothetical protein [Candidatus Peribacteria bacterium]
MKGLGTTVSYRSKHARNTDFSYLELSEIFKQCDLIFITLATNSETKHLITDEMLHNIKTNACIISGVDKAILNHDLLVEKC